MDQELGLALSATIETQDIDKSVRDKLTASIEMPVAQIDDDVFTTWNLAPTSPW
jgi:hypothetical protein